ncbi:hypothetical protein BDB01DRAFT_807332 [Pilobolus umbonatus]|nr:hypothetical protein BDB01DRAFT_807332 [Pilobolus umbonatus]
MNGLDYDLHSRILLSLAGVLADEKSQTSKVEIERLYSKCPEVPLSALEDTTIITDQTLNPMSFRYQQSLDALTMYAVNTNECGQVEVLPRLLSYLKHLPAYQWDDIMITKDPIPADGTTYLLVSALLSLAHQLEEYKEIIHETLWNYGTCLVELLKERDMDYIISFILPSMAGLARALQVSPYLYTVEHLQSFVTHMQPLIVDDALDIVKSTIEQCLTQDSYSRRVLASYWENGMPLSSNRIIHDLLIVLRNIIARVMSGVHTKISTLDLNKLHLTSHIHAAWSELMKIDRIKKHDLDIGTELKGIYSMSLGYYCDIRKYADKRENEGKHWSRDSYMKEIMGLSLQLAGLASIYLEQVDNVLVRYIDECLFDSAPYSDAWVYVASLDTAVLLAVNLPRWNEKMTNRICRFLATPSPILHLKTEWSKSAITVQRYGFRRLSECIQRTTVSQMREMASCTLYKLINEITQYQGGEKSVLNESDPRVDKSIYQESQVQQVSVNVLSAIIGVAAHLADEKVTIQAYSMFSLHRKSFSIAALSVLTRDLVDLAIVSPMNTFQDIINLFSTINQELLTDDKKQLDAAVLNAQILLAQKLSSRKELYLTYLHNLLTLFVENGNSIQRLMVKNRKESEPQCISKLGTLLPVIQSLLNHADFEPHLQPTEETVSLFRNMWFHCTLFGVLTESIWLREWNPALHAISQKTPVLIIESATNYLESDLEYNSVLRGGNLSDINVNSMRIKLTSFLPNLPYEIKSFSFAQVVFALTVYHIEMMRSRMGDCSYILRYFMNDGVSNSSMSKCLEVIVDQVVTVYIKDTSFRVGSQSLEFELRTQMSRLLQLCCHRLPKVHELAVKITDRIAHAFPQIFAEKSLITLLFELIQLLWRSCEAEYREEYCPIFEFKSSVVNVTIEVGDSFVYRQKVCTSMYQYGRKWLQKAMDRSPLEINGLLQDYLSEYNRFQSNTPIDTAHLGRSLALDIGKAAVKSEMTVEFVPSIASVHLDDSSDFVNGFTSRRYYMGEVKGLEQMGMTITDQIPVILKILEELTNDQKQKKLIPVDVLSRTMYRAASYIISLKHVHPDLIHHVVRLPVQIFSPESLEIAIDVWNWIIIECPRLEKRIMVEILNAWGWAQRYRKGLFSTKMDSKHPFTSRMTYAPSERSVIDKNNAVMTKLFTPHVTWIKFLLSRFYSIRHRSRFLIHLFIQTLQDSFFNSNLMSTHPFTRLPRFQLLFLGMKVLKSAKMEALAEYKFRTLVYSSAFNWFSLPPKWVYGSRKTYALYEQKVLNDFYHSVMNDTPNLSDILTCARQTTAEMASGMYMFLTDKTKDDVIREQKFTKRLILLLMDSELSRLSVWCNPLNIVGPGYPQHYIGNTEKSLATEDAWKEIIRFAWEVSPKVAVQMSSRFVQPVVQRELHILIANNTLDVVEIPEALELLLGERLQPNAKLDLKYLKYWAPVPTITAANYFMPAYGNHPLILQYAMRSLEYYPVDTVFFYVPQIVQALRYDAFGYVERYIMEAGQLSQLFAHQIIWNMRANFYIDADKDCIKADPLKPTLERIIENLVSSFTGKDEEFYKREFKFFEEVTGISGYLKEYIKYGQNEKKPLQKKRLDEELAKIKVDVGVYLPSNPDGYVVDIVRTSGRPLQSHAKAPFMATFKIVKDKEDEDALDDNVVLTDTQNARDQPPIVLQSAIFKVGDDCRQDVLALQLIAVFKNIFTSIGLDLYVFPYRVVATDPGRGVIDVIPDSISRDVLGREKVNSMYDYFVAKYGTSSSIAFQRARTNFVQSAAAYSLISYLLQFKDRHNGNIMLDAAGHLIHIDFGFIFDIAPGGITFESSPFKLTTEMVQLMGGNSEEQPFKQFSELVIKGYLACRPYTELIIQIVNLMLQSGLPCFRGETIKRMRYRFQNDKSDRIAADFMIQRIKDSFENQRTVLYDYFQKVTNGIPY